MKHRYTSHRRTACACFLEQRSSVCLTRPAALVTGSGEGWALSHTSAAAWPSLHMAHGFGPFPEASGDSSKHFSTICPLKALLCLEGS